MATDSMIDTRQWATYCEANGDIKNHSAGYYASNEKIGTVEGDYRVCVRDAKAGNERAIHYLAEFAKWKMKQ